MTLKVIEGKQILEMKQTTLFLQKLDLGDDSAGKVFTWQAEPLESRSPTLL